MHLFLRKWRNITYLPTFPVLIKKEIRKIDKEGNETVETISCKVKFNARFMANSLSNIFDNLEEGIHNIKFNDCDCFLEYESVEEDLIKYKCLSFSKDY